MRFNLWVLEATDVLTSFIFASAMHTSLFFFATKVRCQKWQWAKSVTLKTMSSRTKTLLWTSSMKTNFEDESFSVKIAKIRLIQKKWQRFKSIFLSSRHPATNLTFANLVFELRFATKKRDHTHLHTKCPKQNLEKKSKLKKKRWLFWTSRGTQ